MRKFDLTVRLFSLKRIHKKWIMFMADVFLIPFSLWASWFLRLGDVWSARFMPDFWWVYLALTPAIMAIFIRLGLYRAVVRYISSKALYTILKACFLGSVVLLFLLMLSPATYPRSLPIIFLFVLTTSIGGSRLMVRSIYHWVTSTYGAREPVAIYGAGYMGMELVSALNRGRQFTAVAFFDDNPEMINQSIQGVQVFSPNEIPEVCAELEVERVLLAVPNATNAERKHIIGRFDSLSVHVQTVPSMQDIVEGRARVDQLMEVGLEDLLGRDPVPPKPELFEKNINGKVVLVTGAGGSIGSELCRQVLHANPKTLILLERSEFSLYEIEAELRQLSLKLGCESQLVPILGSVCNRNLVDALFKKFGVQTIYHAAAFKHVPLVEANVLEGIRNNVIGTLVVGEAAKKFAAESFVLISTDKAVRPTNIMGTTKRLAEQVVQTLSVESETVFSIVRFGNVLGSSGSVVPLFRKQIARGGPITVTHPDVTRFFMTIPEASQLVIQAGAMAQGGEVFVLDMGESVKIIDLAVRMIELSGLEVISKENPHGDIEIKFTGLRPGEKLYEELLIGNNVTGTEHARIMKANESCAEAETVQKALVDLTSAADSFDVERSKTILKAMVPEYQASSFKADWFLL